MTEPILPPPEPAVDHGTQLGAGTGLLVRILTRCVTATRSVRRAIAAAFHGFGTGFRTVFGVIRRALRVLLIVVLAPVLLPIRLLVVLVRRLRRVLTVVLAPLFRTIVALLRDLAHTLGELSSRAWRAVRQVARRIGLALSWIARLVFGTASRVWGVVMIIVSAILRAVKVVVREAASGLANAVLPVLKVIGALARRVFNMVARLFNMVARLFNMVARLFNMVARVFNMVARVFNMVARVWGATTMLVRRARYRLVLHRRRIGHSIGVAIAQTRQQTSRPDALDSWVADSEPAPLSAAAAPFSIRVYQNEYLPNGGTRVDAIVTVQADDLDDSSGAHLPAIAQVILIDCSGSMGRPWQRMRAARRATRAAIGAMRPGTWFAVVRANHGAEPVFPPRGGLAPKTPETERAARRALGRLWPEGGTAMGRWLLEARDLLATRPDAIPHAILLTDGCNESETEEELREAITACTGAFGCDCRGVGTDWEVAQLRTIATAMHGTVDIIADAHDLSADFTAMADAASHKHTDDVSIHIWTPLGATVRTFQQVAPDIMDLDGQRRGDDVVEYATGSWSTEAREYHVGIDVPAKAIGTEMLAARFTVTVGDRVAATTLVRAVWTDDVALSTRVAPRVEHFTGQAEVLEHIRRGLEARRIGDDADAVQHLGQATRLAAETGHEGALALLASVVDIDDAPTGRIRWKATADEADWMALDTRSTRTSRPAAEPRADHTGPSRSVAGDRLPEPASR